MPVSALQHRIHIGIINEKPGPTPDRRWTQEVRATRSVVPRYTGRYAEQVADLTESRHLDAGPFAPSARATSSRTATALNVMLLLSQAAPAQATARPNHNARAAHASNDAIPSSLATAMPSGASWGRDMTATVPHAHRAERARRHAFIAPRVTTTTPAPKRDDVKIEKIDFSCIERRQNLSFPDMLRQIGRTFKNPIRELANESHVLRYFRTHNRCPAADDIKRLDTITRGLDQALTLVTGLLPGSQPLSVTQSIGGPLFELIADSLDDKAANMDNLSEATEGLLALAQSIKAYSPKDVNGEVLTSQMIVPKAMSFRNNKLSIEIEGVDRHLIHRDGKQFADFNGKYEEVAYSWKTREWFKVSTSPTTHALLPDGKTAVALIPESTVRGWKTYKRVDSDTGEPYGEPCVISKKGRIIPFRRVESAMGRYRPIAVAKPLTCGIGRVKRAPCIISEVPNQLGLLEQRGFSTSLYRVDKRSPIVIRDLEGFGKSTQFYALEKMLDLDDVLIVSESLEGALRYIKKDPGQTYHVYEILPRNVRGVSLQQNIATNAENTKKFLRTEPKESADIDWGYETNGAIFLHEAHVYTEDVTLDKIFSLGSTDHPDIKRQIENLDTSGGWLDYL